MSVAEKTRAAEQLLRDAMSERAEQLGLAVRLVDDAIITNLDSALNHAECARGALDRLARTAGGER